MSHPIDTEAIRARLAEYDPDAPRCTKTVADSRNYAPDSMDHNHPEWDTYTVTHYVPCCRPEGHEGECRNSRRVMGWPGRATLIALLDEVEELRTNKKSEASLRSILDDLIDLFGWEDKTPLHAALHVRNAVNNLRADLAVARSEVQRVTKKLDRLQERLTDIERANVDRWKNGYAAAERQIAAWLDQPCGMSGHDDRWCPACSFRTDIANAIRDGQHQPMKQEKP